MKIFLVKLTATATLLLIPFTVPALAATIDCNNPQNLSAQQSIQCGANGAAGQNQNQSVDQAKTSAAKDLSTTIGNILNVLSMVVGVAAVIMIIIAGLRYVTSGGKQESVTAAKNTIVYAAVGLAIVAFAQILVHFVINHVTGK